MSLMQIDDNFKKASDLWNIEQNSSPLTLNVSFSPLLAGQKWKDRWTKKTLHRNLENSQARKSNGFECQQNIGIAEEKKLRNCFWTCEANLFGGVLCFLSSFNRLFGSASYLGGSHHLTTHGTTRFGTPTKKLNLTKHVTKWFQLNHSSNLDHLHKGYTPKVSQKHGGWETGRLVSFWEGTLKGTNISPFKGTFEDGFPFPKVGYVTFLENNFWEAILVFGRVT